MAITGHRIKNLVKYLKTDRKYLLKILVRKFHILFSDEMYLKVLYYLSTGRILNLKNPVTFNEKLQWLKLYNHNPEYHRMVDKIDAKAFAAERIGDQYIIPTYATYERAEEIDFDKLPNEFVIKVTQGGGGGSVVICKDKLSLNTRDAIKKLSAYLKQNLYNDNKEWPYKDIKPRIIVEKLLFDNQKEQVNDYKFYCFDGVPKALVIAADRYTEKTFDYFDMDFNHLPFTQSGKNASYEHYKPKNFEVMKDIASKLSAGIPHVRVDLYNLDGDIYFGEMTFFDSSGYDLFDPDEWDTIFGNWIKLPEKRV